MPTRQESPPPKRTRTEAVSVTLDTFFEEAIDAKSEALITFPEVPEDAPAFTIRKTIKPKARKFSANFIDDDHRFLEACIKHYGTLVLLKYAFPSPSRNTRFVLAAYHFTARERKKDYSITSDTFLYAAEVVRVSCPCGMCAHSLCLHRCELVHRSSVATSGYD